MTSSRRSSSTGRRNAPGGRAGTGPSAGAAGSGRTGAASGPRAGRESRGAEAAVSSRPAPGRRTTVTGRAAILAVALCAVLVTLAYPARELLAQRAQIAALHAQVDAQQARVDALKATQSRWSDPAYVEAQARDRLHFVMPGQTQYIVLGSQSGASAGAGGSGSASGTSAATPTPSGGDAWFDRLWHSVQAAGASAAPEHPGTGQSSSSAAR